MEKRTLPGLRADKRPKLSQNRMAALVAQQLGRSFSPARYWQLENGYGSEPRDDERSAIAAVLGVEVSDIAWPTRSEAQAAS
jgi:transcriptional regulator with XRE-family HTH domain